MFKTIRHYIGKKKRDAWYEEKNRLDNLLLYFKYISLHFLDRREGADLYFDFVYEGDLATSVNRLDRLQELNNKLNAAIASNMSKMNPFAAKDMYNHFDGMPGFLAPDGTIKFGAA